MTSNELGNVRRYIKELVKESIEEIRLNEEKTKNEKEKKGRSNDKRAAVIHWLKSPRVNCAEIMRQLWHPEPSEEDSKRSLFYKCRDGAVNKDSGAVYHFTDSEINRLFSIKSNE